MKYEIKNRWTQQVQFTAEIDCDEGASVRIKLGLAIKVALKGGADLRGAYLRGADLCRANLSYANLSYADLRGADLRGADLGGLILLARATRSDGHEYFAWSSILGGMVIKAGCRTWIGEDAIEQAREHCQTTTYEHYRAEALRIVDFVEAARAAA